MCRTTAYKSTTCGHRWLTITTRCAPKMGFTTTPVHEFRADGSFVWVKPKFQKAAAGSCPNCDLKGQYNGNTTRMVLASGEKEIQRNMWRSARGEVMMGGGSAGYGYFALQGYQQAIVPYQMANWQAMTPYQLQFAANQQAARMGRRQYYPITERYRYGC